MAYLSGKLRDRVTILNRQEQTVGKYGIDSAGVTWEEGGRVWASVDWSKGKQAMNVGAIDVYGIVLIRMRWNSVITERSRIQHGGKIYQILPETFHVNRQDNTIQFHAQQLINEK